MRVGVLGGTFDPPHVAHLVLAESARWQVDLAKVVFVPAGDPWRKAQRRVTPAAHRLAMLRLAVAGDPYFEVSDIEMRRRGPSYTVDTLQALADELGGESELYFILGDDALGDLPNWKEPRRIAELARLCVAGRGGSRVGPGGTGPALEGALPGTGGRVIPIDMPALDISSTALRERARRGGSLRFLVPLPVEEYIRRHALYGPRRPSRAR